MYFFFKVELVYVFLTILLVYVLLLEGIDNGRYTVQKNIY